MSYYIPENSEVCDIATTEQSPDFALYTGEEFFQGLAEDIAGTQVGDRIALTTMSFEPSEPLVSNVLDELGAAADRGVNVTLAVDAYSFMVDSTTGRVGPLLLSLPFGQNVFAERQSVLTALDERDTAHCSVTNTPDRPLTNPFAGRSHLKIAVVGNKAYLGGPNFHGSHRLDMAIGWEDPASADKLYTLITHIADADNTAVLGDHDTSYRVSNEAELLFDVGKPGQSLILEKALEVIDQAEKWITISGQFFPHGETAQHLKRAAEKGVRVQAIHNHPSNHGSMNGLWQRIVLAKERRHLPTEMFASQLPKGAATLHSAALATEKCVIKGGHNFIDTGVKLGTPEAVLLVDNPTFAAATQRLLHRQVAIASTHLKGYAAPELEYSHELALQAEA